MRELRLAHPVTLWPPRRHRGRHVPGDTLGVKLDLTVKHDEPGAGTVTVVGIRWEPIYAAGAPDLTVSERERGPE